MDHDRKSFSFGGVFAAISLFAASHASASPMAISHAAFPSVLNHAALVSPPEGEVIVGIASFYDTPGELTSSGEYYDGDAFTAAAQLELRDRFGGIYYGRKYRPQYAIAEFNGKRAILKFNDVGPLRPGRKFDLSRAAMAHFGGIELGLLPDFKIVLLPLGRDYTPGPLVDVQLASMDFADPQFSDPHVTVPAPQYVDLGTPEGPEEAEIPRPEAIATLDIATVDASGANDLDLGTPEADAPRSDLVATLDVPTVDISGANDLDVDSPEGDTPRSRVVATTDAPTVDASGANDLDTVAQGDADMDSVSSIDKPAGDQKTTVRSDDDAVDNCMH